MILIERFFFAPVARGAILVPASRTWSAP